MSTSQRAQTAWSPPSLSTATVLASSSILQDGYKDALEQCRLMVTSGHLSTQEYEALATATTAEDVIRAFQSALESNKHSRKTSNFQVRRIFEPLMLRLERFTTAFDMLVQASPQVFGFNPAGIVWGSLKITLTIARDVADTFDLIFEAFEDLLHRLPVLTVYPEIFKSSKLQLLQDPLALLYTDILALWMKTMALFKSGRFHILFKATWQSLRSDFKPLLANVEKHGKRLADLAQVEHTYEMSRMQQSQMEEHEEEAQFRAEARSMMALSSASTRRASGTRTRLLYAPTDLLTSQFTGRNAELSMIEAALNRSPPLVPSRAVIWGMPGVGKTQIALKYCLEFYIRRYTHIFWVSASTTGKIRQGIESLLDELESPERFSPEQKFRLAAARRWLESDEPDRAWLIVFDNVNADTIDTLRELSPKANPHGNMIFTTRFPEVAEALSTTGGSSHFCTELHVPKESDAAKILLANAAIKDDGSIPHFTKDSEKLVRQLGCLPLAIDQVSSFMKHSGIGLQQMLAILDSEEKSKLLTWDHKLSQHQENSVHAAFASSFVDLKASDPLISNLLHLFAFLDSEKIDTAVVISGTSALLLEEGQEHPVQLQLIRTNYSVTRETHERGLIKRLQDRLLRLRKIRGAHHAGHAAPAKPLPQSAKENHMEHVDLQAFYRSIQSPVDLQDAIARLQSLALVYVRGRCQQQVWMHDLVQYMVQYGVTTHIERKFWVGQAVRVIASAFKQISDPESHQQWDRCEACFPHVIAVAANADKWKVTNLELCVTLRQCALYLASRGCYADAVSICSQALAMVESLVGQDDLETLAIVSAMAWVTYRQGQEDLALPHKWYERVLQGRETQLGPNHPKTLTTLNDLGFICEKQGLYAEGEKHLLRALHGRETLYGPNDARTCLVMRNLSYLYFRQGMWRRTESFGLRALCGEEKTLGEENAETIITVTNLSLLYEKIGNYDRAEELALRSLRVREATLPGSHPRVLMSINNLALIYEKQGKYALAEPLYLKALSGRTKAMGANHCRTHRTLGNLSVLNLRMGRLTTAMEYGEKALAGREKFHGDTHPETMICRAQLAAVYEKVNRYTEGEALCLNVLACEAELESSHPAVMQAMQVLGAIYLGQERYDESDVEFQGHPDATSQRRRGALSPIG